MSQQGPNSVTAGASIAGPGPSWGTPGNVTASDNANAFLSSSGTSEYLSATGPGFTIVDADTVNGFLIEIESRDDGHGNPIDGVWLTKDGSTPVGSNLLSSPITLTNAPTIYPVGGPTELGGATWTAAEARASTFGALIVATRSAGTVRVDHVRITVYYTEGGGGVTHDGAASFSGAGTLAGAPGVTHAGATALSGSGALAAAPAATYGASGTLAGTGSLATAEELLIGGAATLAGAGTLSAAPEDAGGTTHDAAATFAGLGLLAVAPAVTLGGSVGLSGLGVLAGSGALTHGGAASLSGLGSGVVAGALTLDTQAALSGFGMMVAAGTTDPEALPAYGVTGTTAHVTSGTSVVAGSAGTTIVTAHQTATVTTRGSQ